MTDPRLVPPFYSPVFCGEGSFRVGFCQGVDHAVIIDTEGWVTEEVELLEGTCEEIRNEAHRLIDVAVDLGHYKTPYPQMTGAESKRWITKMCKSAKTTHYPGWKPYAEWLRDKQRDRGPRI